MLGISGTYQLLRSNILNDFRYHNKRPINLPRQVKDRLAMLQVRDIDLIRKYRFPRNVVLDICDMVKEDLEHDTNRAHAIPVETQVLGVLRLYASGSFQDVIGDVVGVSQPSISRSLEKFLDSMLKRVKEYINMPLHDRRWVSKTKQDFQKISGMKNVLGVTDGSHFVVKRYEKDTLSFKNRRGDFSINAQMTCDPEKKFRDAVVKWPGCSHDSFIWGQCELRQDLLDLDEEGYVLADKGYPNEDVILTPVKNPTTQQQLNYNKAHARTRILIEQAFGELKMAFRLLDKTGGTLLYSEEMVCKIIIVGCMLHNIRIMNKVPIPPEAYKNFVVSSAPQQHDSDVVQGSTRERVISQFPID